MKHRYLFLSLLIFLPLTADYQQQAEQWIATYIAQNNSIASHDLEAIGNLLYFSYKRSATSCKAHEIGLAMLEHTWHGWQNITQTRLNPTISKPYRFAPYEQEQCAHKWVEIQKEYHIATQAYAAITDALLKNNMITNAYINDGIAAVRKQARKAMAKSLFDVQEHLNAFLNLSEHNPLRSPTKGIGIKEFFSKYIPQLAMKTLIEAEHASNLVSEESFKILATIQQASAYVWQAVERERAAFYKAHYQSLCTHHGKPIRMIVDDQGILPEVKRAHYLPQL